MRAEQCIRVSGIALFTDSLGSLLRRFFASSLFHPPPYPNPPNRLQTQPQVIKQVNGNPSPKATARGWEVLAAVSVHFPPSKVLHSYILGFVAQRTVEQNAVGGLALFVMRQLRREAAGGDDNAWGSQA